MIAIDGAMGQLGTAFRERLGDDGRYLDPRPVIDELRSAVVINCAAYGRTKVEGERWAPGANAYTLGVGELEPVPLPDYYRSLERAAEMLGRRS